MITFPGEMTKTPVRSDPVSVVGSDPMVEAARVDALWDRHATPLFSYLLRLTLGDRRQAEDLLQETLLRAWRFLQNESVDVGMLRPWLYTVARRLAIDAGRARQVRPMEVSVKDIAEIPASGDEIDRLLVAEIVRRALMTLSPEHRRTLIEVYYRDRTAKEAAAVLGIPEGTVKSRIHHALRHLRTAIGRRP
jgi:RNA polymerase sigma-70 factor (ECF subfamily)